MNNPESNVVELEFTGLTNTRDRVLVGPGCYDSENCRVDAGTIAAERGYSLQIGSGTGTGSTCYGGCLCRFGANEYFLAVMGNKLYKASLNDSSWTEIATGLAQSAWEFQVFGTKVYAVNETDGVRVHTIGGTDWSGGEAPTVVAGHTFTQKVYNNGTDPDNRILTDLASSTHAWLVNGSAPGSPPASVTYSDSAVSWTFGASYNNGSFAFRVEITLASAKNWKWNDAFSYECDISSVAAAASIVKDSLHAELVCNDGTIVQPFVGPTESDSTKQRRRKFYFSGSRSSREAVTKIRLYFTVAAASFVNIASGDRFTLRLLLGDVWQNNAEGFVVADGPVVTTRDYAVTAYLVGSSKEGQLSATRTTPNWPTTGNQLGSYVRVAIPQTLLGTMGTSDKQRLYRKRKSDGRWVRVGETTNTATPDPIDDHYGEWELADLPLLETANFPPGSLPSCIGAFRASLGLGIGYDLYLSKQDKPLDFEDINSSPDPSKTLNGRSTFVDPSRSEKVNIIKGGTSLWLGTKAQTFFMYGDTAPTLSVPRVAADVGAIGKRASSLFRDGVLQLNAEGLWFVNQYLDVGAATGGLLPEELTKEIQASIEALGISSASVVAVNRGDVLVFSGTKYLRRDRKTGFWSKGTLNHSVVQAAPDYSTEMRLFLSTGLLAKWASGTQFGGSDISWYYETGDIIIPAARLQNLHIVSTGSPSVLVTSTDGVDTPVAKTYAIDNARYALEDFQSGLHIGTKFRFKFSGNQSATIKKCVLSFVPVGGREGK